MQSDLEKDHERPILFECAKLFEVKESTPGAGGPNPSCFLGEYNIPLRPRTYTCTSLYCIYSHLYTVTQSCVCSLAGHTYLPCAHTGNKVYIGLHVCGRRGYFYQNFTIDLVLNSIPQ